MAFELGPIELPQHLIFFRVHSRAYCSINDPRPCFCKWEEEGGRESFRIDESQHMYCNIQVSLRRRRALKQIPCSRPCIDWQLQLNDHWDPQVGRFEESMLTASGTFATTEEAA